MTEANPTAGNQAIEIYDTTLRDGAQTQGVDFSVEDKRQIALALDGLGLDYIEGGWPGANPTDTAFFSERGRPLCKKPGFAPLAAPPILRRSRSRMPICARCWRQRPNG